MGVSAFVDGPRLESVGATIASGRYISRRAIDYRPGRARKQVEAGLAPEQARFALSLPGVRGIHIADFRRDGSLGRLCADLGLSPRPERETHAHRSAVSV